jgi:hypothetical protein
MTNLNLTPALSVVPQSAPAEAPQIAFCSHCGKHPADETSSRVCDSCHLGLVLSAGADIAPKPGGAFLVVDATMSVCAVSGAAEKLLATNETEAVNRHVTELLVPADAEAAGPQNLAVALTWAARGDEVANSVTVRPANTFGVRLKAQIGSCGPPRAALMVFE